MAQKIYQYGDSDQTLHVHESHLHGIHVHEWHTVAEDLQRTKCKHEIVAVQRNLIPIITTPRWAHSWSGEQHRRWGADRVSVHQTEKVVVAGPDSCTLLRKMEGDREAQQLATWRALLSYCIICISPAKQINNALLRLVITLLSIGSLGNSALPRLQWVFPNRLNRFSVNQTNYIPAKSINMSPIRSAILFCVTFQLPPADNTCRLP